MRFVVILSIGTLLAAAADPENYQKWRAEYEAGLKAPGGWLSVAGLQWLHEGTNTIALPDGGTAVLRSDHGQVRYEQRTLKPDEDVLKFGTATVMVIERGGKFGARLRDPNAATRRDFTGCKWFPPGMDWRVQAKWVAYQKPMPMAITNILGMTDQEPSPGYATFSIRGREMRLEPVIEDGELFFMFKDMTSGRSTYGAGRFLYAALPKGDRVVLDFNEAHNPPCAFTAFATCPLPPKQNNLPVAIEAGEKSYGGH